MFLSHPTILSVSIKGVQYNAMDQVVEVPEELVDDLISKYGFRKIEKKITGRRRGKRKRRRGK